MTNRLLDLKLAAFAWLLGCASVQAADYSVTVLMPPGDGSISSFASAITNTGLVVGSSEYQAVRWDGTSPSGLCPAGCGEFSRARAANDLGQIVGTVWTGGAGRAVRWDGSTMTVLPRLGTSPGGGFNDAAYDINALGQAVGRSRADDWRSHATLWNGNELLDLGFLSGGDSGAARAINDAGEIVGYTDFFAESRFLATRWDQASHAPVALGSLGPGFHSSFAWDLNKLGQVVGVSIDDQQFEHATLWNGSTAVELGMLAGKSGSVASTINDLGQAVGYSYTSATAEGEYLGLSATLWNGTVATDLSGTIGDSLINAGWSLVEARGINNDGTILGLMFNSVDGSYRAVLLTPVPESSTLGLLLLGLAFLMGLPRTRARLG